MNEIPGLLEAIRGLGAASGLVFAFLWWLERTERKAAQAENRALTREVLIAIGGLADVTKATAMVGEIVAKGRK